MHCDKKRTNTVVSPSCKAIPEDLQMVIFAVVKINVLLTVVMKF